MQPAGMTLRVQIRITGNDICSLKRVTLEFIMHEFQFTYTNSWCKLCKNSDHSSSLVLSLSPLPLFRQESNYLLLVLTLCSTIYAAFVS